MNPNFNYLTQLANGDTEFFEELKEVMIGELSEERIEYNKMLACGNLKEAASAIHKIKHKVGILGMENGYKEFEAYEHALRGGQKIESPKIEKILNIIFIFLAIN